ncbi:MAG: hypothetical protein GY754_15235 [bacterium]|nr:hypothetical protein [bacterium]
MKKLFCIGLLVVLAFSGCEESGFTDSDSVTGPNADLYAKIQLLQEEIDRLKAGSTVTGLASRVDDLESTFDGVSRLTDPNTGQPTIRFTGVNVQIVSGSGYTNGVDEDDITTGSVNGLGNLIVGYNEKRNGQSDKSGSHNIVTGAWHNYSSYGGFAAGSNNTISGKWSTVSGGDYNTASGDYSSVSAGNQNTASGSCSGVSGGWINIASGRMSGLSGGYQNTASGSYSSVSAGFHNAASGSYSGVSGGRYRSAANDYDWAAGELFQDK